MDKPVPRIIRRILLRPGSLMFAATGYVLLPCVAMESKPVQVSANVTAQCRIQATEDIRFGTLDPAQAVNTSGTGGVTFACTKGTDYRFSVDQGQNFDAGAKKRRMKGRDTYFLPYELIMQNLSGTGQGLNTPLRVSLDAYINGNDYRDLPADAYNDVLRLIIEN